MVVLWSAMWRLRRWASAARPWAALTVPAASRTRLEGTQWPRVNALRFAAVRNRSSIGLVASSRSVSAHMTTASSPSGLG